MADRPRVSMRLHDPWYVFLNWRAGELGRLPAEFARELVEGALARDLQDPATQAAYEQWLAGYSPEGELANDIVAAMGVPGVAAALTWPDADVSPEAGRAARFLGLASEWLASALPHEKRGPAPRLADVRGQVPVRRDVSPALAAAGHGDGQARRQASLGPPEAATDKRQLSDTGEPIAAGAVRNEWT